MNAAVIDSSERAVPTRALVISAGAFVVAVLGAVFFPESLSDYGFLVWLLALIPAFLLCYYRGWTQISVVLGGAMALLSTGYVVAIAFGWEITDLPVFVFIVAAYVGLALGWGWFTEIRTAVTERENAEKSLKEAYEELRQSHSQLQLAQWKLIEAEKLEAVGQLAAGVAHEVKNPLMTLLTGVKILQSGAGFDPDRIHILLEDMREAVGRADSVIMGLLDFSAPGRLNPVPSDLNALVLDSARMVKYELERSQLSFSEELAADLPSLPLDRSKIHQVLVNLLTNAAHATPPDGTITARTRVRGGSDAARRGGGDNGGPSQARVILEIDDTGSGISPDKLSKLFDPFFTTKPTGKGTGLGLAVSRQIVEMHGATIDIQNRTEGGVRATVTFTVPSNARAEDRKRGPSVDDEAAIPGTLLCR